MKLDFQSKEYAELIQLANSKGLPLPVLIRKITLNYLHEHSHAESMKQILSNSPDKETNNEKEDSKPI